MVNVETASRTVAASSIGEDHAGIFTKEKLALLVITDGSGGQQGGGAASEFVVARAAEQLGRSVEVVDPITWVKWISPRSVSSALNG